LSLSKGRDVYANFVAQIPPPPALVHLTATVTGRASVTGAAWIVANSTTKCT